MSVNNSVKLSGVVQTIPQYSHCVYGERLYSFYLGVERLSGYIDILPITIGEQLASQIIIGRHACITGQLRSYNKFLDGASRLILTVFAKEVSLSVAHRVNEICLEGFICKPVIYRTTPFNREITDILLAVNRQYNKSDYIPCILWGKNARNCKDLEIGTQVEVLGRVQSREYEKQSADGTVSIRTAYEVSVANITIHMP
ncbi:single-stranded DNA-binding protein [Clostridia bacterium OttesenSCG-928-F22]|nr:single-stranded DNA-binding protein [Clostridia bacterium OttesenSCG-928-F22]